MRALTTLTFIVFKSLYACVRVLFTEEIAGIAAIRVMQNTTAIRLGRNFSTAQTA